MSQVAELMEVMQPVIASAKAVVSTGAIQL